jgi:hypothetical protein
MTDTDWHVPPTLLHRFTADPLGVDDVTASSIEAHVVECAGCRREMAAAVDPGALAASWDLIADRIDRPRATLGERFLQRLGIDGSHARLIAATPALRAAGLASVVALAVAAVVVSRTRDAEGPFLVLAPLAPLLMVGLSFAPTDDPAAEAGLATPLHGAGLVIRRAVAVLVVAFLVLGVASLALPDLGVEAAGWILPALALTLGSLSLATWMRAETAVSLLAVSWITLVTALRWSAGREVSYATSPTFSLAGQLTAAAIAVIAAALLVARRDRFTTLEVLR